MVSRSPGLCRATPVALFCRGQGRALRAWQGLWPRHAGQPCAVNSASRGRGLTGKPVTESDPSLCVPAQIPAVRYVVIRRARDLRCRAERGVLRVHWPIAYVATGAHARRRGLGRGAVTDLQSTSGGSVMLISSRASSRSVPCQRRPGSSPAIRAGDGRQPGIIPTESGLPADGHARERRGGAGRWGPGSPAGAVARRVRALSRRHAQRRGRSGRTRALPPLRTAMGLVSAPRGHARTAHSVPIRTVAGMRRRADGV
jgi:hypothetical protein